jgi:hypothetical protein
MATPTLGISARYRKAQTNKPIKIMITINIPKVMKLDKAALADAFSNLKDVIISTSARFDRPSKRA